MIFRIFRLAAFEYYQMKELFDVEVKIPDEVLNKVQTRIKEIRNLKGEYNENSVITREQK